MVELNEYDIWFIAKKIFNEEELKRITDYFGKIELEESGLQGYDGNKNMNRNVRSSYQTYIYYDENNSETKWFLEKIMNLVVYANEKIYEFDLDGFSGIQYSEYPAEIGGKYEYHIDTINFRERNKPIRKLSLSILLSEPGEDFEGGELAFSDGTSEHFAPLEKGDCVIFPSFLQHAVKTVTKGVRKSLVVWVEGPAFK